MLLAPPIGGNADTGPGMAICSLPDSPALELEAADQRRAVLEAQPVFGPVDEPAEARITARFPWGYPTQSPYGPQVALIPGTVRPYAGQIYVGTARINCGRFRTHLEALDAVVVKARGLAADRIKRAHREGTKLPRLRERQPWRFL